MTKYVCISQITDGSMSPNYIYRKNDVITLDNANMILEINDNSIEGYEKEWKRGFNTCFYISLMELNRKLLLNITDYFVTLAEWRNIQIDEILSE